MIMPVPSALLYAVSGLRAAVVPRDCATIPSKADAATLAAVYNVVLTRNVSDRVLLATFETAWIESHVNALDCGDQDSVGVFQQRPSQGWGTVAQCIDVQYSTTSFLNSAIANDRRFPRYTPGQIAQSVQYSEFPDRYDQAEGVAKALIAQAQRQAGMPVSTPALSASTSAPVPIISSSGSTVITTSVPLSTFPTSSAASVTSSQVSSPSVAPSTTPRQVSSTTSKASSTTKSPASTTKSASSSSTKKSSSTTTKKATTTTKKSTSTTKKVSTSSTKKATSTTTKKATSTTTKKSSTSSTKKPTSTSTKGASTTQAASSSSAVPTFTIPSPSSSTTTTTSSAPAVPTLAPGTLDATCGALYEAASGDSCASIGRTYDASLSQLLFWNPSLNAQCTNLIAGLVYCVASQVAVPPPSAAAGINTGACTSYTPPVAAGQTCAAVAAAVGVSPARLVQLNRSLDAACSNIVAGKSYCATSIGSYAHRMRARRARGHMHS